MQSKEAIATCSDVIIQQLCESGISVCFANPGTTEMWLVAALQRQNSSIRSILCLQESVVTGACDGYARIKQLPAVALLHLGPGLGNGLCNLHNARRASSPVLVLVGDMATWHKAADPVLNQDIQALASTVSGSVLVVSSPETVESTIQTAVAAMGCGHRPIAGPLVTAPGSAADNASAGAVANNLQGLELTSAATRVIEVKETCCPGSKVVTVVVPHDISWTEAPQQQLRQQQRLATDTSSSSRSLPRQQSRVAGSPAAHRFIRECAAALRQAPRGKAALILGGAALLAEGGGLPTAGRIASALGAALLCEPLPARIDRGAGLPHVTRIPYFPQEAATELKKYDVVLLVDVRRPVAGFGYKNGPSELLSQPDHAIWELDTGTGVIDALLLLERELPGAAAVKPGVNCGGIFAVPRRPTLSQLQGPLTSASLCQTVAALQPENIILVDESLTSGGAYWDNSKGCPSFTHLCLTGGAIGSGPPMATGAAVAAAGQQVINLQADGSALYSVQALWTQAHEKLKVLTIICANNSYAILKVEAMRQRSGSDSLTSLSGPEINWVSIAQGFGVPAGRAETTQQLAELISNGLSENGPFLIHAALCRG